MYSDSILQERLRTKKVVVVVLALTGFYVGAVGLIVALMVVAIVYIHVSLNRAMVEASWHACMKQYLLVGPGSVHLPGANRATSMVQAAPSYV